MPLESDAGLRDWSRCFIQKTTLYSTLFILAQHCRTCFSVDLSPASQKDFFASQKVCLASRKDFFASRKVCLASRKVSSRNVSLAYNDPFLPFGSTLIIMSRIRFSLIFGAFEFHYNYNFLLPIPRLRLTVTFVFTVFPQAKIDFNLNVVYPLTQG